MSSSARTRVLWERCVPAGLTSAGDITATGELNGQTVRTVGSVIAGANVESGVEGRLKAGLGGVFVRDKQVFDGNGNLLAKPLYACAPGSVMYGTNADGQCKMRVSLLVMRVLSSVVGMRRCNPSVNRMSKGSLPFRRSNVLRDRRLCPSMRTGWLNVVLRGQVISSVLRINSSLVLMPRALSFVISFQSQVYEPIYRPQVLVCSEIDYLIQKSKLHCSRGLKAAQVESGCDPTDQTQTFIVTRNAIGRYDAGLVRSYVRAGGIVITEFGSSYRIFNDLFETNFPRGDRFGNCGDNINPPIRLNGRNIFWLANEDVTPLEGISGCGYDISNLPDVVALGGWQEDRYYLGYRDLGLGRLWMAMSIGAMAVRH